MARKPVFRGRRGLPLTLLSALGVLVLAAVPVQVTGKGIDLYALLSAGVLLLVVERTVGDWVANVLGPIGTALAFAIVAAAGVAYLLSDSGRKRAEHFMAVAEAHGYQAAYFKMDPDRSNPEREEFARAAAAFHDPAASPASTTATADAHPAQAAGPPSDASASAPAARPAASGWKLFSFSRSRNVVTARVTSDPDLVQAGEEVVIRFRIIGKSERPPSSVDFLANGVVFAHTPVQPDGTAEARWRPKLPGQYQLRVETTPSDLDAMKYDATLQVLPSRR
jgi:hypothetical protein